MIDHNDQNTNEVKRNKIIEYWNEALLCSPVSSTSHADPNIAYLDNAIEHQVLEKCLNDWAIDFFSCLDIGAGYGRFADLFMDYYSKVVLIEPADRIYNKLIELWGQFPKIECYNCNFESHVDRTGYDLIFASGVLYLYDDEMLEVFMRRAFSMLNKNGIFVVRDFISNPYQQIVKSVCVENGSCHYRTLEFWDKLATHLGFKVIGVRRSKPSLIWLRNKRIQRLLKYLNLNKVIKGRLFINAVLSLGNFNVCKGINPVFIGMG